MAPCAITWCIGLARAGAQHCAVHQKNPKVAPCEPWLDGDAGVTVACEECKGSGECQDCDGYGRHECHHQNCYDEHNCPTCDGTGDCLECSERDEKHEPTEWDARYLAWASDPGWQPFRPVTETW